MATIRFGGPGLPNGTHTWVDVMLPDGSYGGQKDVHPGEEMDEDSIGGEWPELGVIGNTADNYIERGMAERLTREED